MTPPEILISQADFDAFVAAQVEFALRRLRDKPASLMPHLAIKTVNMEGKEGLTLAALAVDFNEAADKRTILMALGRRTYERREIPLAIAIVSEAWSATKARGDRTEPRYCANKREVVLVAAKSIGNERTKVVEITVRRDAHNRLEATTDNAREENGAGVPLLDHFIRGFLAELTSNPRN